MSQFDRFIAIVGEEAINRLNKAHVLVVGLGGVGGAVVEVLARSGVGTLTVIDDDTFEETNLNRQILALHSTIGMKKVDACKLRCKDINPNIKVNKIDTKFSSITELDFSQFSYIVDAVDDVNAKIEIIKRANECNIRVISCMGTAKKFDPLALRVAPISATSVCPLASIVRKKCRELGLNCECVFSVEPPQKLNDVLGSTAYVPNVAGIMLAKRVIEELIKD